MNYPELDNQPQQEPDASCTDDADLDQAPEPGGTASPQDSAVSPEEPADLDESLPSSPAEAAWDDTQEQADGCATPWFLGLLVLVPVPFLGALAGGLVPVVAGLYGSSQASPLGRAQARQAASWGLTFCVAEVFLTDLFMVIARLVVKYGWDLLDVLLPLGQWYAVALGLLVMFHLYLSVKGGLLARQGKTMSFYGIPFFP